MNASICYSREGGNPVLNEVNPVEQHFEEAIKRVKVLAEKSEGKKRGKK